MLYLLVLVTGRQTFSGNDIPTLDLKYSNNPQTQHYHRSCTDLRTDQYNNHCYIEVITVAVKQIMVCPDRSNIMN